MPSLFHTNLPSSSFSFLSCKSEALSRAQLPWNQALSLYGPPIPSFHLWAKSCSTLSQPTIIHVTLNLSILEQVEISEATLHFTAKDNWDPKRWTGLSQIMGQVSACDFFFYYYSRKTIDFGMNSVQSIGIY